MKTRCSWEWGFFIPHPYFLRPPLLFKRKFLNTSLSEHFEILAHRILFKINLSQLQIVSMLFVALTHSYQLRKRVRCCSIHFHPRKNLARYRISPIRKKILPQQKDSPQMISTFDQLYSSDSGFTIGISNITYEKKPWKTMKSQNNSSLRDPALAVYVWKGEGLTLWCFFKTKNPLQLANC